MRNQLSTKQSMQSITEVGDVDLRMLTTVPSIDICGFDSCRRVKTEGTAKLRALRSWGHCEQAILAESGNRQLNCLEDYVEAFLMLQYKMRWQL